jgi:spermidine/putrescine transport system ATP-binding protein
MNRGRFEQLGTPQALYYSPATAFVAGFVGANNRLSGTVHARDGAVAELATSGGWRVRARAPAGLASGAAVEAFIRPEAMTLARTQAEVPPGQTLHEGEVTDLLFDGANSVALLKERVSRLELRIALPQTGAFADLKRGQRICFSFDPQRAICFAATGTAGDAHG